MGLSNAVEYDANVHLLAPADVNSLVLAYFQMAVMGEFFIRIFDANAPFLRPEFPQMVFFAKTFKERSDGFFLCQLKAADLFLSTKVDVDCVFHNNVKW